MTVMVGYWVAYHDFLKPKCGEMFGAIFFYNLPYLALLEIVNKWQNSKLLLLCAIPISFLLGVVWSKWGRNRLVAFFLSIKLVTKPDVQG
jgi:hypothetical protein